MARIGIIEEIVEDTSLQNQVQNLNHEVSFIAATQEEALQKIRETHPDLLLIHGKQNEKIPDGFTIPVIILAEFEMQETENENAILTYLSKPFALKELKLSIKMALEAFKRDKKIKESQEEIQAIFDNSPLGMATLSLEGRFLDMNETMEKMIGYTKQELISLPFTEITYPKDLNAELSLFNKMIQKEIPSYNIEKIYLHKLKIPIWVNQTISPIFAGDDIPSCLLLQAQNITARKKAEEQLFNLTHYDIVTGLANRKLVQEFINQTLIATRLTVSLLGIFIINIDRFKTINDSMGREEGDLLLQEIAKRLRMHTRASDTIARLEGDEFVMVVTDVTHAETLSIIAQKLLEAFQEPFIISMRQVYVTISIGISYYPNNGENGIELLKNGELALGFAKKQRGNCYQFCSAEMRIRTNEKRKLEYNLHHAIEKKEFLLHYQPIINLQTEKIIGAEALIRWKTPEGMIFPGQFIPLAEETNMIRPIGEWVLRTACRQNKKWHDEGFPSLSISVNLSGQQFGVQNLFDIIDPILAETQLPSRFLECEITESSLMYETKLSIDSIQQLRKKGIKIIIDDFGTMYSSFNYLKSLSIDGFKLDYSFTQDILERDKDRLIVLAMIDLAKTLEIKVTAEGLETEEQYTFFKEKKCQEGQGYYISPPLPPEQFLDFIKNFNGISRS